MTRFPSVQLRRVLRVVNGGTPSSDSENWDGDVPWATPVDLAPINGGVLTETVRTITGAGLRAGSSAVRDGSLIVSTRAPIGYVAQVERPTAFNQGCRGLVPLQPVDIRYFRYQFVAAGPTMQSRGQGSTFIELSTEALASLPVHVPPFGIQSAIADYLDRETARINALIAARQKMVALLEERWQAVVDRVIWEDVWAVAPLKHLVDPWRPVMYGIVLPGPDVGNGGVAIVKGGDVAPGRLAWEALCKTTREIEAPFARARLRADDLVIAIRGGIGDVEIVPEAASGANITQDVARIAPRVGVDPAWLRLALRSSRVRADIAQRVTGATVRGLNIWELDRLSVPVATAATQAEQMSKLLPERRRISDMSDRLARQVDLLREGRQSLIAAAVTGEVGVPEMTA